MTLAAPCYFLALQQPKGATFVFGLLVALFSTMTYVYYATVYSALQDVVEPRLRATAVAIYFFAQYVFGASFGTTITGALSDHFAHKAMMDAGAAAIAPPFVASGLHTAMYVIPMLTVLCGVSLFFAAGTVSRDMERMQRRLRGEDEAGAAPVVATA
jgi:MFS family permease